MEDIFFQISGTYGGEHFSAEMYQGGNHEFFTLRWQEDEGQLHIRLIPREREDYEGRRVLVLESVSLTFPWAVQSDGKEQETIFMNGYQSWTDSQERFVSEREPAPSPRAADIMDKYFLRRYGDYDFTQRASGAGQFHGFTYCYFRLGKRYRLLASLSERSGYTVFYYNGRAGQMRIEKECCGLELTDEWNAFDLTELSGGEYEVFDTWFAQMGIPKPQGGPMTGYTSWYNHYQNISEKIILKDLRGAVDSGQKMDIFQIDDGYESYVGDWLAVNEQKFPHGMKNVCEAIHESGKKAGIWLAPFVCERHSRCYREHPEWLVRDDAGRPFCCGSNWGGFYALDVTQEEVQDYLRDVFDCVLEEWGFDLVKLDFLYAACILPTATKTRGQLMCEAMDFLRELVGDKLILGCGVPLGAAFGRVDYCRIGCDVGLDWDGTRRDRRLHRERVSTKNAIGNTIYRRHLDGRAFWNDPDVYLLRDDNIKLNKKQRLMLAQINGLFGSLLFTSDNVGEYDEEKRDINRSLCSLREQPAEVRREKAYTVVEYEQEGEKRQLRVRLG